MCNFKVWVQHDEDLYVVQCTECNTFQVRLHHSSFLFDPFAFMAFRAMVGETYQRVEEGLQQDPVILPSYNPGMELLLNKNLLVELYSLLDDLDTEMKAAQISRLFYQSC